MDSQIVRSAYRKLKSFVYYDNFNLLLRLQLAEFEAGGDIEIKLEQLSKAISEFDPKHKYWKNLFKDISSSRLVKQYAPEENGKGIISNLSAEGPYKVDRMNYFIDCPVELHICAAVWTFELGYKLETTLAVEPYGNKFDLKKEGDEYLLADGLKSYRPYYTQYQKWRDNAVQAAKDLVERDKNALVLGLDIKDFYHSVRLDFKKLNAELFGGEVPSAWKNISLIQEQIHLIYTKHIEIDDSLNRSILPIGLVSSGALANYYLDPLDHALNTKLKPDFYGRYVDDILIVTSCSDEEEVSSFKEIANRYLVEPGIFEKTSESTDSYQMTKEGYDSITIQSEKLSVLHFVSSEPTALLDKFLADIKSNSSEYRLLPEDEVIDYDFDHAAYSLNYSGTGNKLRDIKEFGEDKFGVSKYLAKKIFLALQSGHERDNEAVQKILRFFKGKRAIELFSLWEKLFTFLLVNNDHKAIFQVVKEISSRVNKIEAGKASEWLTSDFYYDHLFAALSMAFSLKPSVLDDERFISRLEAALEKENFFALYKFKESILHLRTANLVRHHYVVHPLLNYVGKDRNGMFYDLIDYAHYFKLVSSTLRIDHHMYKYTPRFVHFHETTLFNIINRVSSSKSKSYKSGFNFSTKPDQKTDLLNESAKDFFKLNYKRSHAGVGATNSEFKEIEKKLYSLEVSKPTNSHIRKLVVTDDTNSDKLKIAIANMSLSKEIFEHAYLRRPKISPERRKLFNSILNQAEKENVDMLFLPEVSVPVAWLKWIADHALKQQRAIVFGLEHWVVGKRAFNFIVTLLPFMYEGFKSLAVNIRLKNHYSPAEAAMLEGYGYIIPQVPQPSYDLFQWRGVHFTAFNCFELSNIEHRARFRSKIDLLVASEFNKDVNYFSNIVESSARDIHCYVAQVNDSKYGDSRITQPSSTNLKDLIKVKGGKNPTILVDWINLNDLREFQLKEYSGQKDLGTFKPTPPDFDKAEVLKRMAR